MITTGQPRSWAASDDEVFVQQQVVRPNGDAVLSTALIWPWASVDRHRGHVGTPRTPPESRRNVQVQETFADHVERYVRSQNARRDRIRAPKPKLNTPTESRMPQGSSISARSKPRQMAPSRARMPHLTGQKWLMVSIQSGMAISGTSAPP